MKTASLPWYDLAEVQAANDLLWKLVRRRLVSQMSPSTLPSMLDREVSARSQWASGHVLLSQACGYDVVMKERERLQVVATPRYRAPGCEGPNYRSAIIVRRDSGWTRIEDLRGSRCVFNERWSHSGLNSLRSMIAAFHVAGRFFGSVAETGSHESSLIAVQSRSADVAAIDCVTLALLRRHRHRATKGLRVIGWTPSAPAPPFVTDASMDASSVDALRQAIQETLEAPSSTELRHALLIDTVQSLPDEAYQPIVDMENDARERGYPELA